MQDSTAGTVGPWSPDSHCTDERGGSRAGVRMRPEQHLFALSHTSPPGNAARAVAPLFEARMRPPPPEQAEGGVTRSPESVTGLEADGKAGTTAAVDDYCNPWFAGSQGQASPPLRSPAKLGPRTPAWTPRRCAQQESWAPEEVRAARALLQGARTAAGGREGGPAGTGRTHADEEPPLSPSARSPRANFASPRVGDVARRRGASRAEPSSPPPPVVSADGVARRPPITIRQPPAAAAAEWSAVTAEAAVERGAARESQSPRTPPPPAAQAHDGASSSASPPSAPASSRPSSTSRSPTGDYAAGSAADSAVSDAVAVSAAVGTARQEKASPAAAPVAPLPNRMHGRIGSLHASLGGEGGGAANGMARAPMEPPAGPPSRSAEQVRDRGLHSISACFTCGGGHFSAGAVTKRGGTVERPARRCPAPAG